MSSRKPKRRRVEFGLEEEPEELDASTQQRDASAVDKDPTHQDTGSVTVPAKVSPADEPQEDPEKDAKEREVWDAFREEHYELLEQLPLSLHRAFTLIHELDQQAQDNLAHIAPAVLKYISLRKELAASTQPKDAEVNGVGIASEAAGVEAEVINGPTSPRLFNGHTPNGISSGPASSNGPIALQNSHSTSNTLARAVQNSSSTRELLVRVAQSSEEVTRACAEKVYLAQHAYDLVDRYIRGLDRAIKEQEASISLGLRPGTHTASIILPEVIVPQSTRGRVVATPPPPPIPALEIPGAIVPEPVPKPPSEAVEEAAEVSVADEGTVPPEEAADPSAPSRTRKKGKKRKSTTSRRQTAEPSAAADAPVSVAAEALPVEPAQAPLTLRIPAQNIPTPIVLDEMPPDPNEPRYCFCNQVSFGDMIACDNPTCAREWVGTQVVGITMNLLTSAVTCTQFHIGCVGLTKIPKGNWYCRECVKLMKRPKSRKRAR
ncbi:hypothetical protein BN946_scf185042.g23 [Trametes cinnabarina]|uniref:Inhibitor of growth protein N-terminal histone-binding domain-containing protein n=1 Tax=Pycnoporus cinnabarinus TaxID=5643 RepID=A0A060S4J2_PYCCI|nr:hypothetical protein BN946_scf185042.g23 [Trametes cinnabarina]